MMDFKASSAVERVAQGVRRMRSGKRRAPDPGSLAAWLACYTKTIDCLKAPRDNRPFPEDSQGESLPGKRNRRDFGRCLASLSNFTKTSCRWEGKGDSRDLAIGSRDQPNRGAFTRTWNRSGGTKLKDPEEIPLRRRLDSVFNGDAAMISALSSIPLDPQSGLGKRLEPMALTSCEDLSLERFTVNHE